MRSHRPLPCLIPAMAPFTGGLTSANVRRGESSVASEGRALRDQFPRANQNRYSGRPLSVMNKMTGIDQNGACATPRGPEAHKASPATLLSRPAMAISNARSAGSLKSAPCLNRDDVSFRFAQHGISGIQPRPRHGFNVTSPVTGTPQRPDYKGRNRVLITSEQVLICCPRQS